MNNKEEIKQPSNKKSVKKNYIFNAIYQVFLLITPLITTPYISRVLSAEGIGQFSFSSSLQNYFSLFAALGFGYYAQRQVANFQDDKKEQSKIFWEILIVRSVSTGIALAVNLILYFFGVYKTYSSLMLWWSLNIASVAFDVTFLLQGNEDFGRIVRRSIFIKIISIILIYVMIKKPSDVWLYVVMSAGCSLLGNLSLWVYLPKYITKVNISELKPWRHFRPAFLLFIPNVAASIYTILDKTLIGVLIADTYKVQETQLINGVETLVTVTKKYSDLENGYYEQSEKIVKMCLNVIIAMGTVMIPRNSKLYSEGKTEEIKGNFYLSSKFVWVLGIPMMFGLAATAPNIIPWFLGNGYEKCILLMQLFTPLIILIGFSNVFGAQYLIPTDRDNKYTYGIFAGSIVNIILNCFLIRYYWSVGAVIASLIAEFSVTFVMYLFIRKEISLKKLLVQSIKPLVAGLAMFTAVYVTQMFLEPTWYFTIILIFEGIVIYCALILILKDEFVLKYLGQFRDRLNSLKNKHH